MDNYLSTINISYAIEILNQKRIIAYPTESVFGMGCDPDSELAVNRLLEVKQRSADKGFILIAADYLQLKPYIDDSMLNNTQRSSIFNAWPGPITFVFPVNTLTPRWLTGHFNSIAIRVTNHPLIIELCRRFGKPLISTSANLFGKSPCRTVQEVYLQFGKYFPVIEGKTGGQKNPSEIRDILTYKILRNG